jgi:uncharacterized protein with ATP-grasp and redox domains
VYEEAGLVPEREGYDYHGSRVANIVARIEGRAANPRRYLLGAHYDTEAGTDGADDNASAVAVQLETAGAASRCPPRLPNQAEEERLSMKAKLDCLPCFLTQGLKVARLCDPDNEELHRRILLDWSGRLREMDLDRPPPAIAGELYGGIASLLGVCDPFQRDKKVSNARVLELLPRLRELVRASPDPLLRAMELSIVGNYIDSGVARDFRWEERLESETHNLDTGTYSGFRRAAVERGDVLIVGDNAGEIGFDTILVSELQRLGCRVAYAVRGSPVINDATLEDADEVGMTGLCRVISSGADTPGAVLSRCTPEFVSLLQSSPVVLSKGQGNLEALSEERDNVFYALKVKCAVVAQMTGLAEGSSALIRL